MAVCSLLVSVSFADVLPASADRSAFYRRTSRRSGPRSRAAVSAPALGWARGPCSGAGLGGSPGAAADPAATAQAEGPQGGALGPGDVGGSGCSVLRAENGETSGL